VVVGSRDVEGDALVVVRPEQITMSAPRDGLVTARVADVTFYGHDTAVHLEVLPSGPAVVARISGCRCPQPARSSA
jgi:iron(III) transport system ATP-binding protein